MNETPYEILYQIFLFCEPVEIFKSFRCVCSNFDRVTKLISFRKELFELNISTRVKFNEHEFFDCVRRSQVKGKEDVIRIVNKEYDSSLRNFFRKVYDRKRNPEELRAWGPTKLSLDGIDFFHHLIMNDDYWAMKIFEEFACHIYHHPEFTENENFDTFRFGNSVDRRNFLSPHSAVFKKSVEIVKSMVRLAGPSNILKIKCERFGQSPFHVASSVGSLEIVIFFADTLRGENEKRSLLGQHPQMNSVELFNLIDNDGYSPLHLAARRNHYEVCEFLVKNGSKKDVRTRGWIGFRPVDFAKDDRLQKLLEVEDDGDGTGDNDEDDQEDFTIFWEQSGSKSKKE